MKKTHRIMIVDDDDVIVTMLKQLLEASGFSCETAQDGKTAIKMIAEGLPELIILDVMMPEMDGFEVCEALRKEESTREIPIIFLSAQTEIENRMRGFETGADDYVLKPFSFDELLARIKVALRKTERLERERKKVESLEQEARLDKETGLLDRKNFTFSLSEEIKKSRYSHVPLSLMVIDIDRLAEINTRYGYLQGNRTLAQVAQVLAGYFTEPGTAARYEGGEFAVIVPDCDLIKAESLADEVRKKIEDTAIESYPSDIFHVTVSIGIAEWNPGEKQEQFYKRAEGAMYRSKKTGRNKVACG